MAFRKRNCACLYCPHINCKMCILGQILRKRGFKVPCSWKEVYATAEDKCVVFGFYDTTEQRWERVILLHSEIYLVHLWGAQETHGLSALYCNTKYTLADLAISDDVLSSIPQFGPKSMQEVKRIQEKYLNRKAAAQLPLGI